MASPGRYSRYRSDATESDTSRPSARLGMSEYTSQRLAELRARRAEMEMHDGSKTAEAITTSGGSSVNSSSSSLSSLSKDKDKESPTHSSSTSSTPSRNYRQTETTTTTSNITPASSSPTPAPRATYKTTTDIMKERETEIKTMSLDRNIEPKAAKNGHDDGDDFVGFSSLPEQVHRKAVKRGFDFTLMVVGESGLGKSTLVNSLFLTDLYKDRKMPKVEDRVAKTVQIDKKFVEFEEKGVRLRLTIVDTPGFSDSINAEECWKSIESYVNQQFNQYLKDESGLNRRNIKDGRVHCCLYFVSPYGHGLRQLDVKFMKQLHDKVNIVPVIAKADCLTHKEIFKLKERILDEIEKYKIQIYEFPECDSDEDDDFKKQDSELKAAIPFAVIGSNTVIDVGGKKIRGRQYPWGIVEVDNPKHCDFAKLRQMLISTHMQDLKEVTRDIHYENFRARQLAEQLSTQQRERTKLKRESQNLDAAPDADRLLQQKDEEIRRMQEMIAKMQRQLGNNNMASVNGLGNL